MNRKKFLSNALMGLAISLVPEILRPIDLDGRKCVFDEKRLNERLDELRKYPLSYSECYELKPLKTRTITLPTGNHVFWIRSTSNDQIIIEKS